MPIEPPQPLPSDAGTVGAFKRELALLMGPAYQPADGTLAEGDLHALGTLLSTVYDDVSAAAAEIFARSASQLLTEWETRVGVAVDPRATVADRQATLESKRRATGGASAARTLAALRAIDPSAALHTISSATAATLGDPAYVFLLSVVVSDATFDDPAKKSAIEAVMRAIQPAHADHRIAAGWGFKLGTGSTAGRFGRTAFGR